MSDNPLEQYYYDDDQPQHPLFANLESIDAQAESDSSNVALNDNFPPKVNLARENQPEFWVSMEAFFDLSFWMAEQIEDLVATHQMNHATVRIR